MIVIQEIPEPLTGTRAATGAKQRDVATCEWNGQLWRSVSGTGASMALARQLVEAGCPDQPFMTTTVDGQPALEGRSLHRWAQLEIVEDGGRLKRRRFTLTPTSPQQDAQ